MRDSGWSSEEWDRLLRSRLTATTCAMARLVARRILGRANVSLDALGLQNLLTIAAHQHILNGASEHLTQRRAAGRKDQGALCSLDGRASFPGASRHHTIT